MRSQGTKKDVNLDKFQCLRLFCAFLPYRLVGQTGQKEARNKKTADTREVLCGKKRKLIAYQTAGAPIPLLAMPTLVALGTKKLKAIINMKRVLLR